MQRQENSYVQGKRDVYIQQKSDPQLEKLNPTKNEFDPFIHCKNIIIITLLWEYHYKSIKVRIDLE